MKYDKKGYDEKSIWKWILLYIVIGGILYAIIYYIFFADGGAY